MFVPPYREHFPGAVLAISHRKNLNLKFTTMRLSILKDRNEKRNGRLHPSTRRPSENNQSRTEHRDNGSRLA